MKPDWQIQQLRKILTEIKSYRKNYKTLYINRINKGYVVVWMSNNTTFILKEFPSSDIKLMLHYYYSILQKAKSNKSIKYDY